MNSELFDARNLLEKERGIPVDFMVDKITKAIITACKNSYGNEDARVEVNAETVSYTHLYYGGRSGLDSSGRDGWRVCAQSDLWCAGDSGGAQLHGSSV